MIPKIIFQTSKKKNTLLQEYYVNTYKDYKYVYFDDIDAIEYLNKNLLPEFPDSQNKFHEFTNGSHKADFLRYYWLYINGGVYIDTDIEIVEPLDSIVANHDFVGVVTKNDVGFNGFIACSPKHPIIYNCLQHAYRTSNNDIKRYMHFCYYFQAINSYKGEKYILKEKFEPGFVTHIIDMNTQKINMIHYYKYKNRVIKKMLNIDNQKNHFVFDSVFNTNK